MRRKMISTIVRIMYMVYKILAVDCTFGTNLLTDGPGLSAFIRFM